MRLGLVLLAISARIIGPLPCGASILPSADQTATFVVPGQEGMHRELIPAHIAIVHCSYELEVVAPGTTFGFDIVGSGFTEAFYKIISVDANALDITIKNLRLVTANQIHGQIEVGTEATTQYIRPLVIIRGLPVFRAPEPFGVVRFGEVLDIELASINDSGQWGRFRVTTNLDQELFRKFRLEPTHASLEISGLKPAYPFFINGVVTIGEGLRHGQYGIIAYSGKREIFRQVPLVDVVKPTVGRTGTIHKVEAPEKAHRPGDALDLLIAGSAYAPDVASLLTLRISPFAMGDAKITYVSAGLLQASLRIPSEAPVGIYDVSVLAQGKLLHEQRSVFGIVPPNWLGAVKSVGALMAGQTGQITILGRDITEDYAARLRLGADTEGLTISNLRRQSPTALIADIRVAPDVAPGDYIIHVLEGDRELKIPRGNIVKVTGSP